MTLATNDSYSLGALVVAHSLKKVSTQHQLAVLITPGVSDSMKSKLQDVFNVVQLVDVLDSKDSANLAVLKRPELGITFTKLHCWNLTQFEKCVFLDADVVVSYLVVRSKTRFSTNFRRRFFKIATSFSNVTSSQLHLMSAGQTASTLEFSFSHQALTHTESSFSSLSQLEASTVSLPLLCC